MIEANKTHDSEKHRRRLTKRGRIILTSWLVVVLLLLAGPLYSHRHQIHLLIRSWGVPPPQPVQITPLTLSPSAATPARLTGSDWTMYHADPARTGYVAGVANPTRLT